MLKIKDSKLLISVTCLNEAPVTNLPEFIMVGRSNVGKSSFINNLCNRKNLAYISKTPGKTRLINLYKINEDFILTDLPGYGYAKVSASEQKKWQKRIEEYLIKREEIKYVFHLLDARHEPQKNDLQMHEWLQYYNLPVIVILTKSDYLSKSKVEKYIKNLEVDFNREVIPYSAKTSAGRDTVLSFISKTISGHK